MKYFDFFTLSFRTGSASSDTPVVNSIKEAIKTQRQWEKVIRKECEAEISNIASKKEREKLVKSLFQKKILENFPYKLFFSNDFAKKLQKKFIQTLAQEFSSTREEETPRGFLTAQRHKSDVLQNINHAFQDFKKSLEQIVSSSTTQSHDEEIYRKTENISDILKERMTLLQQTTATYKKYNGSKEDLKNWKNQIKNCFSDTIQDLIQFFNEQMFTKNEKCLASAHLMEHTAFILFNMQPLIKALGCQNLDEKADQQNSFVRLIKKQARNVQDHYKGVIRREKEGAHESNF